MKKLIPLILLAACGTKLPARSAIDCKLDVLEPYLEAMTREAVAQVLAGDPNPTELILSAGVGVDEARLIADQLLACYPKD